VHPVLRPSPRVQWQVGLRGLRGCHAQRLGRRDVHYEAFSTKKATQQERKHAMHQQRLPHKSGYAERRKQAFLLIVHPTIDLCKYMV
jgi:hypothetical protein